MCIRDRDLPIMNRYKRVMMVCEAFIYRNPASVKSHLEKIFNYDKNRVITSTEALNIDKVPSKMVVVGGGVIGLELGSVFARLGTSVEVVEYMDKIIPTMDTDCSKELMLSLIHI